MTDFKPFKEIKAARPVVRSKRLRIRREDAADAALDRDIGIAYRAMVVRVAAHNVAVCAFSPRASPSVH